MWRAANDNSCMELGGQGRCGPRPGLAPRRGYAMAALLVGMSIMAILMGAALPVWNKQAQREREEEYLFRAHEYARAVMKFRQRIANTNPPTRRHPGRADASSGENTRIRLPARISSLSIRRRAPACSRAALVRRHPGHASRRPGGRHAGTPPGGPSTGGTGGTPTAGTGGTPAAGMGGTPTAARWDPHGRHRRPGAGRRNHRRGLEEQGNEHQDLQRPHALRSVGRDLPGREAGQGAAARSAAGAERARRPARPAAPHQAALAAGGARQPGGGKPVRQPGAGHSPFGPPGGCQNPFGNPARRIHSACTAGGRRTRSAAADSDSPSQRRRRGRLARRHSRRRIRRRRPARRADRPSAHRRRRATDGGTRGVCDPS